LCLKINHCRFQEEERSGETICHIYTEERSGETICHIYTEGRSGETICHIYTEESKLNMYISFLYKADTFE
jgi:uncharacterized protein YcgL (UPF0745 family)